MKTDHQRPTPLRWSCSGIDLRFHHPRLEGNPGVLIEQLPGTLGPLLVAGGPGTGRVSHRCKRLRVNIAALAQRLPIFGDEKVHTAIIIETVLLQELQTRGGELEPAWILLHGVIGGGVHPGGSPLKPHRLVAIDAGSIPIERCDDAAMLAIPAVLEPEGERFSDQVGTIPLQERFQIIHRHCGYPSMSPASSRPDHDPGHLSSG